MAPTNDEKGVGRGGIRGTQGGGEWGHSWEWHSVTWVVCDLRSVTGAWPSATGWLALWRGEGWGRLKRYRWCQPGLR